MCSARFQGTTNQLIIRVNQALDGVEKEHYLKHGVFDWYVEIGTDGADKGVTSFTLNCTKLSDLMTMYTELKDDLQQVKQALLEQNSPWI